MNQCILKTVTCASFFLVFSCGKIIQHKIDCCNHFKGYNLVAFRTHKAVQPTQLSNFRTFLSSPQRDLRPTKQSSERVSLSKLSHQLHTPVRHGVGAATGVCNW